MRVAGENIMVQQSSVNSSEMLVRANISPSEFYDTVGVSGADTV
jgi:hypothetical protein